MNAPAKDLFAAILRLRNRVGHVGEDDAAA
jgi:hypothetical protein